MKSINLLIVILLSVVSAPSYSLGDLLMSSAQRQLIDTMRERGSVVLLAPSQTLDEVRINGFYYKGADKRHKSGVWVNGQALNGRYPVAGINIKGLGDDSHLVDVEINGSKRSLKLKAGQSLNLGSHKLRDAYQR